MIYTSLLSSKVNTFNYVYNLHVDSKQSILGLVMYFVGISINNNIHKKILYHKKNQRPQN